MEIRRMIKGAELHLKKAAPDIMFFAGIALSAFSVYEFCKKAPKAEPIVNQYKDNLEALAEDHKEEAYDDNEYRKIVVKETVKTGTELAKIYWLPATMWVGSTALIGGSHYILKDRNAALGAIAAGLGAELKTLHQRIVEKYGEEGLAELKYGTETKEIETKSIDEKTGEEVVNKNVVPVNHGGLSIYARFFDETCAGWTNNAEYNKTWLLMRQKEANDRLKADGFLFLNDVYDILGMKRTKAGAQVGWRYMKNNPSGDNKVSFNIFNDARQGNRDFVNGYQPIVLLDFNVDGPILSTVPERDVLGNVIG